MSRREDLAWAAGLFEGEGCLHFQLPRNGRKAGGIRAHLTMVDEDVVRRFAEVIGRGRVSGPIYRRPTVGAVFFFWAPDGSPSKKPVYRWEISSFENVQAMIAMLWPWWNTRKRLKAREVLEATRANRRRVCA